jgi:hypothetical protein
MVSARRKAIICPYFDTRIQDELYVASKLQMLRNQKPFRITCTKQMRTDETKGIVAIMNLRAFCLPFFSKCVNIK